MDINSMGGASSLPDLTNVEFSCGLDVPIEEDDSPTYKAMPFHYPGPSKLAHSTMQAPPNVSLINVGHGNMVQPYVTSPPVLPDYRNSTSHSSAPLSRKFRPIVPAGTTSHHFSPPSYQSPPTSNNMFNFGGVKVHSQSYSSINGMTPPTISLETSPPGAAPPYSLPYMTPPPAHQHAPPLLSPPAAHPVDNALLYNSHHAHQGGGGGYAYNIPQYLDLNHMIYQKQALQQKMAGMNFSAPPMRSHSEENLLKSQKDFVRAEDVQENPFMGNMSNANSVPCVYVESSSVDPCVDTIDSPTTGTGSPSTSASHASSPPLTRPLWLEGPHSMSDYMFREWPMDSGAGGGDKTKFGSPLSHHKSLTELNKLTTDYMMELSPNSQSKAHQLSLPSIVMNDLLTVDEALDKQLEGGAFLPVEFEMEEEVMESLLRDDGFVNFDNVMGEGWSHQHQHHRQINF